MTLLQLKTMLASDVNRSDKEAMYPIWINRALRAIQTGADFSCMKTRADATVSPGTSSAALPARFKQLTREQFPVTVVDPSLITQGAMAEVPCEVMSREQMIAYRASTFVPSRPANVRGRLSGLPVFVENSPSGWTLNILDTAAEALTFRVSHLAFLADLVADGDSNYLTVNYPELVENKVKEIAFTALNDPIATSFSVLAATKLREAEIDDFRRSSGGRVWRMGG